MCILCVIQKWSRRVATMLPWLVIPLIGLWALSQLLPPAFRFEITSPRLACVFVLLVTLFWYEILMPQLSAWRVRRNARLRERKRFEAIELQKLRKTATRRCRNCLTPYRDQNPGGGRFMCSYCGHISKRPVLDLPVPPGLGISHSGIIKDLVGKSGKILNGKVWSENGWICGQDWSENSNWVGASIPGKSGGWRKSGNGLFGGDEHCLTENSYSGIAIFACKLLTSFILGIRWLWRKIFRVSSSSEECSSDADHRGILAKIGENGANLNESRGEKARRKAEEKRQARIEKGLLEEEERKQREEVARLVEERRRLRDEKLEAEKDCSKSSSAFREKERKKEAEKRRQEKRKEKDKVSSKSNSDAEELEKRISKESVGKQGIEKSDHREQQRTENVKGQSTDNGHGVKNISVNNYNRGNTGTRYFDRMKGTLLSSSKAFTFGKGQNNLVTVMKENKFNSSIDHPHTSANRRDSYPPERVTAKTNMNGDDKNIIRPVHSESQPWTSPKKTWQQLFTRSSSVPQNSNANVIGRPQPKFQAEVPSPPLSGQSSLTQSFDNPINFGLPSPFNLSTYPTVSATSSSLGFSPAIEPIFSHVGEVAHEFRAEEQDLFEDPCYVPDPVSLLGPVSESLDNFQLDLGDWLCDRHGNGKASHFKEHIYWF
ncbi:stress response protein NST1-like [Quillaja saponaria]|uniref:Stress response protein NST1-like n=1 Tax=Quillaja saponaria TaxID=32244 RepID=A0AAD7L3V5_QUISA|nr:stress response protein NST1-like [Quillaja saponaria]